MDKEEEAKIFILAVRKVCKEFFERKMVTIEQAHTVQRELSLDACDDIHDLEVMDEIEQETGEAEKPKQVFRPDSPYENQRRDVIKTLKESGDIE